MHSTLLKKHGLNNQIFGCPYNFRYQTMKEKIIDQVNEAVEKMDISPLEVYSCHQQHTGQVVYADGMNGNAFICGRIFDNSDGLITDKEDIALFVKFADCTPIVLYDPVQRVQAIVHSGWRGTAQRISHNALNQMIENHDCQLEDIIAFVGPSIDQENYEVGPEVYDAFKDFKRRDTFFKPEGNKYLLDMSMANVTLLKQIGITEDRMEVDHTSTYNDNRLHSARKEGSTYQLNAMFTIMPSKK